MRNRAAIRFGVPALLMLSTAGALAVSLHTSRSAIPSFAFGSHVVLAVEIAPLFFYAALLLLVPSMRALVDGELPVELSMKGARWKEGVEDLRDGLVGRLAEVDRREHRADLEFQRETEKLGRLINEIHRTQDADYAEVMARIDALEKWIETKEIGG